MAHDLPTEVPLTGADWFLLAFDEAMRKAVDHGNVCHLVVELEGALDLPSLQLRLDDAPWLQWLASLRLHRRPWRRAAWRVDPQAPPLSAAHHHLPTLARVAELFEYGRDVAFQSPVGVDLVTTDEGRTAVLFSWHHAAFDGRGGEAIAHALAAGDDLDATTLVGTPTPADGGLWTRLMRAKQARDFLWGVAWRGIGFLRWMTPRRRAHVHYQRLQLTAEQSATAARRAREHGAVIARSAFHLAATGIAVHAVRAARGEAPADLLVPVPQDGRKRAELGPVLTNRISLLFYRLSAEHLPDLRATVAGISEQLRDLVRARMPAAVTELLGMCRSLPLWMLLGVVKLPTLGRMATFGFSDMGSSLDRLTLLFDRPVLDATHYPANLHPPGLTVVFYQHGGRLAVTTGWLDGLLDADEVEVFHRTLRAELLGPPGTP